MWDQDEMGRRRWSEKALEIDGPWLPQIPSPRFSPSLLCASIFKSQVIPVRYFILGYNDLPLTYVQLYTLGVATLATTEGLGGYLRHPIIAIPGPAAHRSNDTTHRAFPNYLRVHTYNLHRQIMINSPHAILSCLSSNLFQPAEGNRIQVDSG